MNYKVKKSDVRRMRVRIATVYAITFNAHELMLLFKSYILALSVEEVHISLGLSNTQLIAAFMPLQNMFVSFPFFITPEQSLTYSFNVDISIEGLLGIKNTLEARIVHCEEQRDKGSDAFNEKSWMDMRMLRCDLSEMYTTALQPVDEISMTEVESEEPASVEDSIHDN